MPRFALLILGSLAAIVACQRSPAAPSSSVAAGDTRALDARDSGARQFVIERFVDYSVPVHAGPGPHPTEESDQYALVQGGIRWFSGTDVTYWIRGTQPVAGGDATIEAAAETLDAYIVRNLERVVSNPSANPCGAGGGPEDDLNTVQWTTIDGPGGVLASTGACRNVATKEIVGFLISIDFAEDWSTTGAPGTIDVSNVMTHEWGHVAGLGHVNGAPGGCLTMYRFSGDGEIQKRTLGLGDKLGLVVLYGVGDASAGPGCGL
jgi:hypothetical protein